MIRLLAASLIVGTTIAAAAAQAQPAAGHWPERPIHFVVAALAKIGVEAEPSTQQQFADRIAADIQKWREVIAGAGIKPQ